MKPGPFVEAMVRFIEKDGVRIVGGCCGTTPDHIKLLAETVETLNRAPSPSHPLTLSPSQPAKPGITSWTGSVSSRTIFFPASTSR